MGQPEDVSLSIFEETPTEQTIFLVKNTFNKYLVFEFTKQKIPREKWTEETRRKLPILGDAIERGYNELKEQIVKNPIVIPVAQDRSRVYSLNEQNEILWHIEPMSEDPFKQMRMFSEMEESGEAFEGTTFLLQDEVLIQEMLKRGLMEQKRIYNKFVAFQQDLQRSLILARDTTKYLPSFVDPLLELHTFDQKMILEAQEVNLPAEEIFFHQLCQDKKKGVSLEAQLDDARNIMQNILALHGIFKDKERPVQDHARGPYKRALVINLLTNISPNITSRELRDPVVTIDEVKHFLRQMKELATEERKQGGGDRELKNRLFSYFFILQNETILKKIFEELGYDEVMGREYLYHLTKEVVEEGKNIADELLDESEEYMLLAKYRIRGKWKGVSRLTTPQEVVNKVFSSTKNFPWKDFKLLSEAEKKSVVSQIFTRIQSMDMPHDPKRLEEIEMYYQLLHTFGMDYNPKKKIFSLFKYDKEKIGKLKSGEPILYEALKDQIAGGNSFLVPILEDIIVRACLPTLLKDNHLPSSPFQAEKFLSSRLGFYVSQDEMRDAKFRKEQNYVFPSEELGKVFVIKKLLQFLYNQHVSFPYFSSDFPINIYDEDLLRDIERKLKAEGAYERLSPALRDQLDSDAKEYVAVIQKVISNFRDKEKIREKIPGILTDSIAQLKE
ncbi:MAG: hypothetical protein Q7S61_02050 [bacterium]|nr:hypothetical protein [bacterium]